ncbi:undecaprenyl-phosphate glucose phosphotransferase [Bradyrhizobium manausense]|uniref:undecaprenyl-phosphate glucose phosphotransferase n=1 Tax=Bradyrhizobium manausense TaxID=989370 RepID=UPI001BA6347D|nr:undecaprenyl-phosphate glucose phosphotransferase [Bradyrhizobium manausense]MBR1092301.1 undecaprenyl-phosphate glucose phosphotransferase [Bradyrhizobium manausense]
MNKILAKTVHGKLIVPRAASQQNSVAILFKNRLLNVHLLEVALKPHEFHSVRRSDKVPASPQALPAPNQDSKFPILLPPAANDRARSWTIPFAALRHLLASFDAFLIVAASYLGGGLYQIAANGKFKNSEQLIGVGLTAAVLYVLVGQSNGFYEIRSTLSRRKDAGRIFANWMLVSLLLALVAFLMKSGADFSRGSVVSFELLALILLVWSRHHVKGLAVSAVADGQVSGQRAVLLGTRDELAALGNHELLERYGITEVDRVPLPQGKGNGFSMTEDEAASVEDAVRIARESGADEVVLVLPWNEQRKLELLRDRLRISPLPVQLLPDRQIRALTKNPSYRLRHSLSLEIQRAPLSFIERLCKRALDIVGASIGLLLLTPLMVMTGLAIKLDSVGPVFFRQRRNGFNSRQFPIFKFRTMSVMEDGANVVQAQRHDARVTRVGRLLRRTSIDEIPQLINVLRGEMSLVGPRPHALAHDSHYGNLLSEYAFRHHVKPGITGWAQIHGYRGETARVEQMRARIEHDIWYINNWSLYLDLKILVLTCFELPRSRNAY